MDWAEAAARYIMPPAILALAVAVLRLWKASNPSRQEKHHELVHKHASLLTGLGMKSEQFDEYMRETKGHGERLKAVEVKLGNVETVTGEMRLDIKELLKHARSNGGK